jgi:hypothetical protein
MFSGSDEDTKEGKKPGNQNKKKKKKNKNKKVGVVKLKNS